MNQETDFDAFQAKLLSQYENSVEQEADEAESDGETGSDAVDDEQQVDDTPSEDSSSTESEDGATDDQGEDPPDIGTTEEGDQGAGDSSSDDSSEPDTSQQSENTNDRVPVEALSEVRRELRKTQKLLKEQEKANKDLQEEHDSVTRRAKAAGLELEEIREVELTQDYYNELTDEHGAEEAERIWRGEIERRRLSEKVGQLEDRLTADDDGDAAQEDYEQAGPTQGELKAAVAAVPVLQHWFDNAGTEDKPGSTRAALDVVYGLDESLPPVANETLAQRYERIVGIAKSSLPEGSIPELDVGNKEQPGKQRSLSDVPGDTVETDEVSRILKMDPAAQYDLLYEMKPGPQKDKILSRLF